MKPDRSPRSLRGFTLIELMIVVSIIGILAAIAIPKFADLVRRSKEGATKGNLGALRGALTIYYGDLEGQYPYDMSSLTMGSKYLREVPVSQAPDYHSVTASISYCDGGPPAVESGEWCFDRLPIAQIYGKAWVNCTHTDTKGILWTSY